MELKRYINELISQKRFDVALKLCELESLQPDLVILEELNHKFKNQHEKNLYENQIQKFWNNCDKILHQYKIHPKLSSNFFIDKVENVEKPLEKYVILKLGLYWLQKCDVDDTEMQNIEIKIWWLYLQITDWEDVKVEFIEDDCLKMVSSEIRRQARISQIKVHRTLSTQEEIVNFNNLIGILLNSGQIIQATRLETMFKFKTESLQLIDTCMKLAEGDHISPEQLNLLSKRPLRQRSRTLSSQYSISSVISETSDLKEMTDLQSQKCSDTQQNLQGLIQQIKYGIGLAGRVLCCYRISQAISRPYARIITTYNAGGLLKMTLTGDFDNKLELANDIMFYHNWDKHQICEFLCAELVAALSSHVDKESQLVKTICLWGYPLDSTMHLVLELCPVPSILGTSLLQHSTAPLGATTKNVLVLAGELLIRAHDCFTKDCNMEGISKVLTRVRSLVMQFTKMQAWAAIIRLLTGLARYNEMDYVFQILQENEQFEW